MTKALGFTLFAVSLVLLSSPRADGQAAPAAPVSARGAASVRAIPRLIDLGLKPGMIAGAIIAVFAQRLVRKVCPQCRVAHTPDENECRILGVSLDNPPTIYEARQGGCQACAGQGYKGRIAVAEILLLDEELDEVIAKNESKAELKRKAVEKGFKNMKDDGILKVLDGITTLQALASVVDINK